MRTKMHLGLWALKGSLWFYNRVPLKASGRRSGTSLSRFIGCYKPLHGASGVDMAFSFGLRGCREFSFGACESSRTDATQHVPRLSTTADDTNPALPIIRHYITPIV